MSLVELTLLCLLHGSAGPNRIEKCGVGWFRHFRMISTFFQVMENDWSTWKETSSKSSRPCFLSPKLLCVQHSPVRDRSLMTHKQLEWQCMGLRTTPLQNSALSHRLRQPAHIGHTISRWQVELTLLFLLQGNAGPTCTLRNSGRDDLSIF